MLFGLIMYISIFKAEVGGKLRPRSQLAPPTFTYRYGYSFILYVSGFLTTELAGTSAIFLFIYSYQNEWYRQYLKYQRHASRQQYYTRKYPTPHNAEFYHLNSHSVLYPCRRHPQAYINTTSTIANYPQIVPPPPAPALLSSFRRYSPPVVSQRRYFFNKESSKTSSTSKDQSTQQSTPASPTACSVHRNLSNSLKDVSYDFPPYPPPPPATISYPPKLDFNFLEGHRTFSRDTLLADISVQGSNNIMMDDFSSPSIQSEFVTFDLDDPNHLNKKMVSNNQAILTLSPTLLQQRLNHHPHHSVVVPASLLPNQTSIGQQTDCNVNSNTRPIIRSEFSIDTLRRTTPV